MRSLLGLQDDQQVDLNVKPSLDIHMLNNISSCILKHKCYVEYHYANSCTSIGYLCTHKECHVDN
jgi:hypothetical protein